MDRKAEFEQKFVGCRYVERLSEMREVNGSGFYPVVSEGRVIAIFDCANPDPAYSRKPRVGSIYSVRPLRSDWHIDADKPDTPQAQHV